MKKFIITISLQFKKYYTESKIKFKTTKWIKKLLIITVKFKMKAIRSKMIEHLRFITSCPKNLGTAF